ncbi:MAG TPA: site-specific DNA-methyltransferase [Anaerolineae bacterium]|nr:site-specific DNA-methyltransferase [Anaerolineae bacterium]
MIVNANSITIPMVDQSVHCVVTSPPYFALRDYQLPPTEWPTVTYTPMAGLAPVTVQGCDPGCAHEWGQIRLATTSKHKDTDERRLGLPNPPASWTTREETVKGEQGSYCQLCGGWRGCLGLEPTPEMFVGHIVAVFREIWRVLRDDGTCWVNFGDSYATGSKGTAEGMTPQDWIEDGQIKKASMTRAGCPVGLKPKDLCGIPWRVAFALQADGWYLRNDIIWHKPNPMPESVTDRCTKGHEYLFLLSKNQRYFYDNEAVKEESTDPEYRTRGKVRPTKDPMWEGSQQGDNRGGLHNQVGARTTRNRRTVWTIPTRGYSGAHFATFPPALVTPCILAATSAKGVCPECAAPWERVVETRPSHPAREGGDNNWFKNTRQLSGHDARAGGFYDAVATTVGWRPICEHYPHTSLWPELGHPRANESYHDFTIRCSELIAIRTRYMELWRDMPSPPATVLDPFCGSGTVGEVCNETGRKFVGLDLSSSYLRELALPRAENQCTMESVMELPMFAQGEANA